MSSPGEDQKPKRDIKKLLAFAYLGLNLAAMGVGSYLVYVSTLGYTAPSISSEELNREVTAFHKELEQRPMMYTMEQVNTNLNGVPRRLIRLQMSLEMLDAVGFEEVIGLGAQARDGIVRIINSKTFDDLESLQGKLHLKNEIIAQLNGFLEHGVVKNVYFSDFVVQ